MYDNRAEQLVLVFALNTVFLHVGISKHANRTEYDLEKNKIAHFTHFNSSALRLPVKLVSM